MFLGRGNAGRGKVGCPRKLGGTGPTQNQVRTKPKPPTPSSQKNHFSLLSPPVLVPSQPTQNNTKPDSGFPATSPSSYTAIFLEIDEWVLKI